MVFAIIPTGFIVKPEIAKNQEALSKAPNIQKLRQNYRYTDSILGRNTEPEVAVSKMGEVHLLTQDDAQKLLDKTFEIAGAEAKKRNPNVSNPCLMPSQEDKNQALQDMLDCTAAPLVKSNPKKNWLQRLLGQ